MLYFSSTSSKTSHLNHKNSDKKAKFSNKCSLGGVCSASKPPIGFGPGYLVYFFDRDMLFLRVSLYPIFSRTGYQNKAVFLEPVVKKCQKGNRSGYDLVQFLFFGVYFPPILPRIEYHLKANIFGKN